VQISAPTNQFPYIFGHVACEQPITIELHVLSLAGKGLARGYKRVSLGLIGLLDSPTGCIAHVCWLSEHLGVRMSLGRVE
jgi:hypothetical protein